MRHVSFFFLLLTAILSGCEKLDKLTHFTMEYEEEVVVPGSSGLNLPINLFTPDIESDAESTFAVNDTRKDLVEEITLTKMELTLTSPSGEDFSFLQSISIFISAEGLDEERIAWKDPLPSSVTNVLELETTNVDLKEYIKKDAFSLRVNTVTDELIASDHHINLHSEFFVDAKILGQ